MRLKEGGGGFEWMFQNWFDLLSAILSFPASIVLLIWVFFFVVLLRERKKQPDFNHSRVY